MHKLSGYSVTWWTWHFDIRNFEANILNNGHIFLFIYFFNSNYFKCMYERVKTRKVSSFLYWLLNNSVCPTKYMTFHYWSDTRSKIPLYRYFYILTLHYMSLIKAQGLNVFSSPRVISYFFKNYSFTEIKNVAFTPENHCMKSYSRSPQIVFNHSLMPCSIVVKVTQAVWRQWGDQWGFVWG